MRREHINKGVLLLLVLLISALFFDMIKQFLMPIFMAGLFSALLSPTHRWLSKKIGDKENLASLLLIFALIFLVLTPLVGLIIIVVSQATTISQSVSPWVQTFVDEPTTLTNYMERLPFYHELLPYRKVIIEKVGMLVGDISTYLIINLQSVAKLTVKAIFSSIIMLYVMFYFLTTGEILLRKILYAIPLHDRDERLLLYRFTSVTKATIKGTMIIGAMQGSICGLAFALAGIQGPVFWGTLMAVTSIIPAFGTAIIWVPAMIILILKGSILSAGILLIFCGLIAGNLDNIVRPRLVGKDTEMHDLLVLFGTLGGISLFGILGIILGPIVAALFTTIWEIYGKAFEAYLPDVGPLFPDTQRTPPLSPSLPTEIEQAERDEQENNSVDPLP